MYFGKPNWFSINGCDIKSFWKKEQFTKLKEYIGETKQRVLTRPIEHQEDSMTRKWEASGTTKHCKDFHRRFNWLDPKTFSKLSKIHERIIKESLEINNLETKAEYDKSIKMLNRDRGNIINANSWMPSHGKINMMRHANTLK